MITSGFFKLHLSDIVFYSFYRSIFNEFNAACCFAVCTFRFRPAKGKQEELKSIIERFKIDTGYEKAWKALAASDCLRTFFLTKSAAKQAVFKEHVCYKIVTTLLFVYILCILHLLMDISFRLCSFINVFLSSSALTTCKFAI